MTETQEVAISLSDKLTAANLTLTALTTLLWAIYVYYTVKTFREIKKQTDLQIQAFMLVIAKKQGGPREKSIFQQEARALADKWGEIITRHTGDTNIGEKNLSLTLNNKGRTGISWWKLTVHVEIEPGEFLKKRFNIGGEIKTWSIQSSGSSDFIDAEQSIDVPVIPLSSFPISKFKFSIEYLDMRGVRYTTMAGDTSTEDTNPVTIPGDTMSVL